MSNLASKLTESEPQFEVTVAVKLVMAISARDARQADIMGAQLTTDHLAHILSEGLAVVESTEVLDVSPIASSDDA